MVIHKRINTFVLEKIIDSASQMFIARAMLVTDEYAILVLIARSFHIINCTLFLRSLMLCGRMISIKALHIFINCIICYKKSKY